MYVNTFRKVLDDRFQSVVITTGVGPMTDRALLNLRHFWAPLFAVEVLINSFWLILDVVRKRISSDQALFHVHSGANLAPLIAARITGIPVLWTIHETTPSYRWLVKFGRWLLRGSSHSIAVVAHSSSAAYGLENTTFLPASVDESFWSYSNVSEQEKLACSWSSDGDAGRSVMRILSVGNLNPLKGADVLLGSLELLPGPFHLKLVGSELVTHKDFAHKLKEQSGQQEDRWVEFLGRRDKSTIRSLLASSDVFVLPSRSEACPIVLLEAMAMGCRIVASDVGDVAEMLASCPNAVIFRSESTEECANAIGKIRSIVYEDLSGSTQSCIGETWQLSRVVEKTAEVYQQLISEKNQS